VTAQGQDDHEKRKWQYARERGAFDQTCASTSKRRVGPLLVFSLHGRQSPAVIAIASSWRLELDEMLEISTVFLRDGHFTVKPPARSTWIYSDAYRCRFDGTPTIPKSVASVLSTRRAERRKDINGRRKPGE
jgi:hypothetical protein